MPTLSLTDEQKINAIYSIWSNINKLRIAQTISSRTLTNPAQIIEETNLKTNQIGNYLNEMIAAGVIEKADYHDGEKGSRSYYRMTPLGKKIVTLLD